MAMEDEEVQEAKCAPSLSTTQPYLQNFRLYETRLKFYMVGRDKSRTYWRVLIIDRSEPYELNVRDDCTTYSERECSDLLRRIHEGNKSTGGLKFVTTCYGIVGFIRFLGPYYMLLITKRRQIGAICGHIVYAISKSEMIPIEISMVQSSMALNKDENRYKKILYMLDLTKDFFFSYSYGVMRTLQKNLCDKKSRQALYEEAMCVWNEFLTRGIRNQVQNTLWTVALVYGFFKQSTLSAAGQDFRLTLIARRSRHYAGTRYLKRGVNEKGRVANDVETEQIVFEDVPEGSPVCISSIVQNRGSIPLFWSQETSRLNIKPDISMSRSDPNYEATRLHFENLVKRYGNPIIILNLIKTNEKKPRESILRAEFANAIEVINKDLAEENRLKFLHLDLNKHSRSKATNVLLLLAKVATYALTLTGSFHCQLHPSVLSGVPSSHPLSENLLLSDNSDEKGIETVKEDASDVACDASNSLAGDNSDKNPTLQKGVLRTNCIDCLDRTNVAQYAYGLAALGHQLHVLGIIDFPKIDLGAPLADDLMAFYEKMGDTLAHQYGGSGAHNKIFSERRGQWKAATQSQEFFRTLQRFYSNVYMDEEKQNAINLFLGHFQPQQGKPAIWELGSDQEYKPERNGNTENEEGRTIFKRCWSDGNILRKSSSPSSATDSRRENFPNMAHLESSSDISASQSDVSYSSNSCHMTSKQIFGDEPRDHSPDNYLGIHERMDSSDCSNFVDLDWLSSSGHSCEDLIDRSMLMNSSSACLSLDNVAGVSSSEYGSCLMGDEQLERGLSRANGSTLDDFSDTFVDWVTHGEALCLRSS